MSSPKRKCYRCGSTKVARSQVKGVLPYRMACESCGADVHARDWNRVDELWRLATKEEKEKAVLQACIADGLAVDFS